MNFGWARMAAKGFCRVRGPRSLAIRLGEDVGVARFERPRLVEMIVWGCFVQYLHMQLLVFIVSSVMSHTACGMNSFVERNFGAVREPVK